MAMEVREIGRFGLGRTMHEDPQVPNYGRKGSGKVLKRRYRSRY